MDRFVLDAYAARSCPVKVHNLFDPTVPRPATPADESLHEAFTGGREFEDAVLDRIVAASPDQAVDLRPLADADPGDVEKASVEALAAGAMIVVKPLLPRDWTGHRSGRPDLLVRHTDAADRRPGYVPVEVKHHRVLERVAASVASLPVSTLERPALSDAASRPGLTFRTTRETDLIQMAHYWRLLEASGFASEVDPIAGVIGTDAADPDPASPAISWVSLTDKLIRTFARTSPDRWRQFSALDRYDHEHAFRVKVAEVAARRADDADHAPMVRPIKIKECESCVWWQACGPQMGDQDISVTINKSPLDVREISVLRGFGIASITDLADADLDALLPDYLPQVAHREMAEERLRAAQRRSRLIASGIELERISTEPIDLPAHELEIDLDIETAMDDRVYLWGFLVDDHATGEEPSYHAFSRFEDLTNLSESALARQAMTWLLDVTRNRDAAVYHYSDYELVHADKLAASSRDPRIRQGASRLHTLGVDMFTTVRKHYFGTHGLGLKAVARAGAGFDWRDEDAGGLNSQRWFDDAVHLPSSTERAAARRRVLDYNEDDVRATHALRAWLRTNPGDARSRR